MKARKQPTALRLALLPILCAAIVGLEVFRPSGWFRFASFLLLFFLLADLASLLRGRMRDGLLILASLAFGISVIEALLFVLAAPPILTTTPELGGRVPVMGWGPLSAGRYHVKKTYARTGKTIYDVAYTIDSNLLRETKSCSTCAATIDFFGDSMTFGEGLNDADTLPQIFANDIDRRMRIINLGYSGYGPQQFLREEQTGRFDKLIGPHPKLFIFLTSPWHAERTSCKAFWVQNGPRYILENNKVVYKGLCSQGPGIWLRKWMKAIHSPKDVVSFVNPFLQRPSHADMELYIRIILAATHLAKEKYGVPVIIPFYDVSGGYLRPTGFTNEEIMKRLREGGAHVVEVTLTREQAVPGMENKLQIAGDGHPTGLANQFRAAILKRYIEQNFPSVLQSPLRQSSKLQ